MLTEEDETKLNIMLLLIGQAKVEQRFPKLTAYDVEWLSEKLKEANDELKGFYAEIERNNRVVGPS